MPRQLALPADGRRHGTVRKNAERYEPDAWQGDTFLLLTEEAWRQFTADGIAAPVCGAGELARMFLAETLRSGLYEEIIPGIHVIADAIRSC